MAFVLARRRAAFGLGAAGLIGASGCAGVATTGSAGSTPDLSTAPGRLRAFMLMRGALDDRLVIGFLSGRYHGVVHEELTPLYGVLSVTFTRYRSLGPLGPQGALASGGYRMATFEHAYYTDVDSGAVLTQWRNPYNGRTVDVPVWSSQPAARTITPDLHFQAGTPMPNMSADHRVLPPERLGDEVVFVERGRYRSDPPPPGRPFRYSELVTLRASAAALGQRDVSRVPCSTAYGAVMSWRPWLQMGDQPGHLMVQGAGAYGAALDAVPAVWLEATRRLRPELIAAPGQRLEALVQAS